MTGRRHRISASSGKSAVLSLGLTGKRARSATTASAILPQQHNISDSSQLKNDVELRLQAMKDYMESEHASIVKRIDAQSCKLKKRWKSWSADGKRSVMVQWEQKILQDRQSLTAIAEATDTDWRNFVADYEEDTRENQNSRELLFSKLNASSTQFAKTYIPELLKSVQTSMDTIKNRYARSAKSAGRLSAREKMKGK